MSDITNEQKYLVCSNCGDQVKVGDKFCTSCGVRITGKEAFINDSNNMNRSPNNNGKIEIPKSVKVMRFIAWFDLVASIITSLVMFTETNPNATNLGIGFLFQGVLTCSFFLVLATIAENLIAIRHNSSEQKRVENI